MKRFIYFLVVFVFSMLNGYSENRSIVIVGNKTILESDVKARMSEKRDYNETVKELILEKMLIFQAEREDIKVTSEELEAEINRIKKNFPNEEAFSKSLENQNILYLAFKKMSEERIKMNKLVRQKIINKIDIGQSDVMNVMKEIQSNSGNSYRFSMKWFDTEEDSKKFIDGFDSTKEEGMTVVEWIKHEEIIPEVLAEILKIKEGDLTMPFKLNNRYLVLLLKGIRQDKKPDVAELFARARNIVYQRKFNEQFDLYIKELQSTIPVFYSE